MTATAKPATDTTPPTPPPPDAIIPTRPTIGRTFYGSYINALQIAYNADKGIYLSPEFIRGMVAEWQST